MIQTEDAGKQKDHRIKVVGKWLWKGVPKKYLK